MDNEKYTVSLIQSIEDYVYGMQYFALNKRITLRALGTYRILHWLYNWADWYEVSEPNKLKIEELMNCIVLRNSALVLPEVIPQTFYSNVSSPQNMWTWRIIQDYSNTIGGDGIGNKTLTVQSSGGSLVSITLNKADINSHQDGITNFIRIYTPGEIVQVTAPLSIVSDYLFDYWLVDGIQQSAESISIDMTTDHTIIAHYRAPHPPLGSIIITKEILSSTGDVNTEDFTQFNIKLSKAGSIVDSVFKTGVLSLDYPLIFSNLELGSYTITEEENVGYIIHSSNPVTVTLVEGIDQNVTIINQQVESPPISTGNVTVNKIINNSTSDTIPTKFTFKLTGVVNTTPIYRSGTTDVPALFDNVPFDTYTLEEIIPRGFTLISTVPTGGTFILNSGNINQTVTITNHIS